MFSQFATMSKWKSRWWRMCWRVNIPMFDTSSRAQWSSLPKKSTQMKIHSSLRNTFFHFYFLLKTSKTKFKNFRFNKFHFRSFQNFSKFKKIEFFKLLLLIFLKFKTFSKTNSKRRETIVPIPTTKLRSICRTSFCQITRSVFKWSTWSTVKIAKRISVLSR